MASAESSSQQQPQSVGVCAGGGYLLDHKATSLKNYAQAVNGLSAQMSSLYWPTTFDSAANINMYAAAASAYSQCQATLAAATAGMQTQVSCSSDSTGGAMAQAITPTPSGLFPVTRTLAHSTTLTPKKKAQPVPDHLKDNCYWERRKRNNESARRSRESRRQKEEQVGMRVVYLEQENVQLKTECSMLRSEIEHLRCMLRTTAAAHR